MAHYEDYSLSEAAEAGTPRAEEEDLYFAMPSSKH